ncbi:DUF6090 family protein [Henriciella mobilis]|uniref:Uncharacterized protein n=1 Tax=Henriciella mobilis TaxID=2305467 RepID=A0A399R7Q3_9PROT|nr:DUF6090 family protein [Henriciella mobilis]RIJ14751.1 hypothetical protein D1231_14070 [Henriciella mobilis]RIJ21708.1 hypothetical protein D1227_09210 [Henriciella mobilis]RIJ26793.1 hypothetical protein D1223_17790 [Henriciella mobilis]
MILQRLATSIRKQDWFTVLIETLIVVFGVFIGLQVNNWNGARQDRAAGLYYLSSIGEDIASDAVQLEAHIDGLSREAEHAEIIVRYLEGEDVGLSDWAMFQLIYFRAGWTPFTPNSVTYDELVSAGQFKLLPDAALRREIGDYYAGLEDFSIFYAFQPPLREIIRGKYSPETQAYMWQTCFTNANYRLGYGSITDCPAFDDPDQIARTLQILKQTDGLADAVRYTQSIRLIVLNGAPTDLEEARMLSAKIAGVAP